LFARISAKKYLIKKYERLNGGELTNFLNDAPGSFLVPAEAVSRYSLLTTIKIGLNLKQIVKGR